MTDALTPTDATRLRLALDELVRGTVARRCADCHTGIDHLHGLAKRCAACALRRQHQREQARDALRHPA